MHPGEFRVQGLGFRMHPGEFLSVNIHQTNRSKSLPVNDKDTQHFV
jgi:hypothetical protein